MRTECEGREDPTVGIRPSLTRDATYTPDGGHGRAAKEPIVSSRGGFGRDVGVEDVEYRRRFSPTIRRATADLGDPCSSVRPKCRRRPWSRAAARSGRAQVVGGASPEVSSDDRMEELSVGQIENADQERSKAPSHDRRCVSDDVVTSCPKARARRGRSSPMRRNGGSNRVVAIGGGTGHWRKPAV